MLRSLLVIVVGADAASLYSFHSFRIALACELLAAGASSTLIQALCRWRSEEAVKIYARFNLDDYVEWLRAAATKNATSVRTSSLPTFYSDVAIAAA